MTNLEHIKIAAFDLDDTVLLQGKMTSPVKKALTELKAKGLILVVATARDICQIPKSVLDIFDYKITSNGASIFDKNNNQISTRPMDSITAIKAIDILKMSRGYNCLYCNGSVVATPFFLLRLLTRTKYKRNKNKEDSWAKGSKKLSLNLKKYINKNNATVFRIQSFCKNSMYAEIAVKLLKNRTDVCPILGNDNSIETTANNITKANALEKLCKDLNLDTKTLIAFGDSANDFDMLKMAGFSVAMGNADSKLKDISNYITDPVTQDGAAKAINYLFLQKNPQ